MLEILITNLIWIGISTLIAVWWYHWGYERGKNDECRRWNSLLEGLGFHITSPKKVPLQNEDDKSVQAQDAYWFQK